MDPSISSSAEVARISPMFSVGVFGDRPKDFCDFSFGDTTAAMLVQRDASAASKV